MKEAISAVKIKHLSLPMHAGKPHEKVLSSQSRQWCHDEIFFPPYAGREAFGKKFYSQNTQGVAISPPAHV